MRFNFHHILLLSASFAALSLGSSLAQATPQTASHRIISYNIKAGDLNANLVQLSRISGVQLVTDPALLRGKKSNGLKGNHSLSHALETMLVGQNLSYSLKGDMVIIKAQTSPAAAKILPISAPEKDVTPNSNPSPKSTDSEATTVVVITGFRNSLTKALNEKRAADNVIDVVNAEDIGKFPANNIAEALLRVPGISITRDRGEGLFVRVRGLGPNFQNVTIDGRSAAVNENVRDSGQSGRQFRFDTMSADLVSGIEVIKSPLASHDEGAIGGTINIRTFKPLDFKKPTTAMSLTYSHVDLAETTDPKVSGLMSWNTQDRSFGALIALNYSERSLRSDRITGVSWAANNVDLNADGLIDANFTPSAVRPTLEFESRKRYGLTAALQWRPSDQTEINLSHFYTYLDNFYDELTYSADFSFSKMDKSTTKIRDGAVVGGTITNGEIQIGREIDYLTHDNMLTDLTVKHQVSGWGLTASLSQARAFSNTDKPITRTRVLGNAGVLSFYIPKVGDGIPTLNFQTKNLNEPFLPFRRLEWRENSAIDEENSAQFDAKRDFSFGPFTEVSGGFKFRDRSRRYDRRDINFINDKSGKRIGGNNTVFPKEFYEQINYANYLGEVGATLPKSWLSPNRDAFMNILDLSLVDTTPLSVGDRRNSYYVAETIKAAYGATKIDTAVLGNRLRGEIGVRYAKTEQTSEGFASTTSSSGVPVSFTKTYENILPSLNLVYEVTDKLQLRASSAKVITRPSLADLSPRLTLNSSGKIFTAVGGNPLLEPFEATQYDLTSEWYYAPGSAVIAGLFYKDISRFVYNQNSTIPVDRQNYLLTAPVNGGEAWVSGLELALQHNFKSLTAPFDGLGLLANYTWTDSEATYSATLKDKMQNVAQNSYSLTVFYEKAKYGARLSYSWVDDVLASVGTGGLSSLNEKAFGSLDGNLSYKLNDTVSFIVEAQNLTNEAQWQFSQNREFGGYTFNGRTVSFGVRAKF